MIYFRKTAKLACWAERLCSGQSEGPIEMVSSERPFEGHSAPPNIPAVLAFPECCLIFLKGRVGQQIRQFPGRDLSFRLLEGGSPPPPPRTPSWRARALSKGSANHVCKRPNSKYLSLGTSHLYHWSGKAAIDGM